MANQVASRENLGPTPQASDALLRRPLLYWAAAGGLIFVLQVLSGCHLNYALFVFGFLTLTYLTAIAGGGVASIMGVCVIYLALQHVLVYNLACLYYWTPADARLICPETTMAVYTLGMGGLCASALTVRACWPSNWKPLFDIKQDARTLYYWALACTILNAARMVLTLGGSKLTALNSINIVVPLSVAFATAHAIVASRGRRSVDKIVVVAILAGFSLSFVGAGRTGMVAGIIVYILTCVMYKFKFRAQHFVGLLVFWYIAQYILLPYGGYARSYVRTKDWKKDIPKAIAILGDVAMNPGKYQEMEKHDTHVPASIKRFRFFRQHTSSLDRYSIILSADAVVDAALRGRPSEMERITPAFESLLPTYLNPRKGGVGTSNSLAHRVTGLIGKNDYITQITLGFMCDAFDSYRWQGVFIISFLIGLGYLSIWRLVCRQNIGFNAMAIAFAWNSSNSVSEETVATQISNIIAGVIIVVLLLNMIRLMVLILQFLSGGTPRYRTGSMQSRLTHGAPGVIRP